MLEMGRMNSSIGTPIYSWRPAGAAGSRTIITVHAIAALQSLATNDTLQYYSGIVKA